MNPSGTPWMFLVGAVLGACSAAALWAGMQPVFARPVFARTNHRGATVPVAGGLVVVGAVLFTQAALTVLGTLGWRIDVPGTAALSATVTAAAGFGLLGLLDDMAVDEAASGYRAHAAALLRGRLNAGSFKLVAGPMVALVVVGPVSGDSTVRLLLDGALVALSANLANLFDRAPGRVAKLSLVASAALVAATAGAAQLLGVAVVAGAVLAMLWADLRERVMLGDTGSNPVGAALGLGVVLSTAPVVRTWVLVVVVALNLASEVVSFSAVIDRTAPLRWFDRLGRPTGMTPHPGPPRH